MLITQNRLFLFLIIFLAAFLRFYRLTDLPPAINWDEASIGYNAYSISQTLKDEHGRFLPFDYFAAFGDYKPPVAIYLTAISEKLFGLTPFATRFPSAFLGVLTVFLTYLLVNKLFKNAGLALLSSFILSISPWHTLVSRAAFEANIATFFIVLAVTLFIHGIQKRPWLLIFSAISFFLTIYTFNSPRLFIPLFIPVIFLIYRKELLKIKLWAFLFIVIFILGSSFIVPHLLSKEGRLRFNEVNIFSELGIVITSNNRIKSDGNTALAKIIHNRRMAFARSFLIHYFDAFTPSFLFIDGDINPKFSTRDNGELFLIEIPFLLGGFYYLFRNRSKSSLLLFFWLFLGLIPAGTARETPHALRSLVTLPVWQVIIAIGLYFIFKKIKMKKVFLMALILFYLYSLVSYLHNYYFHYPKEFSQDWQYGFEKAVGIVKNNIGRGDEVWVTNKYGRPYIFFLYFLKYDPGKYRQNAKVWEDNFGFYHVDSFDKFKFGPFDESKKGNKKIIYVGSPLEVPKTGDVLGEIKFLNNQDDLKIVLR